MTEAQFQNRVKRILDQLGWFWWHTPNKPRNAIAGHHLKQGGMKSGVSDCIIFEQWRIPETVGAHLHTSKVAEYRLEKIQHGSSESLESQPHYGKAWHYTGIYMGFGIAIELKIGRKVRSMEQVEFHERAIERCGLAVVCYTLDEVWQVLKFVLPKNGVFAPK